MPALLSSFVLASGLIATERHSPGARTLKTNRMITSSKIGQIGLVVFRFMAPFVVMSLDVQILGDHVRISPMIGTTEQLNRIRLPKEPEDLVLGWGRAAQNEPRGKLPLLAV